MKMKKFFNLFRYEPKEKLSLDELLIFFDDFNIYNEQVKALKWKKSV